MSSFDLGWCGPGLPEPPATTASSVRVQQQLMLSLVSWASTVITAASVTFRSSVVSCLHWEAPIVTTVASVMLSSQPPRPGNESCGQPEATATTIASQRFTFSNLGRHRWGNGAGQGGEQTYAPRNEQTRVVGDLVATI